MLSIICLYLYLKKWIHIVYNKLEFIFFGVKNIEIIDEKERINNVIFRFIIYSLINKIIAFVDYFRNYLMKLRDYADIKTKKLQMTKIYNNGKSKIILDCEKLNCDFITFTHIINCINFNDYKKEVILPKIIFIKFSLKNGSNDNTNNDSNEICLKKYLIKYRDIEEKYHHTLKNIITFNNITVRPNTKLIVVFYRDKKKEQFEFNYQDIENKHINFFYRL